MTVTSCVTADNCEIFSTILLLESERPAISLLTTSICSISVSIFLLSCSNVCAASIILSPCSLVASTEELTDTTTSSALSLSSLVILVISSVKFFVCSANCLICSATTAKPLPASPALALSIEALSAKRLVWLDILSIIPAIFSTFLVFSCNLCIDSVTDLLVSVICSDCFLNSSITTIFFCILSLELTASSTI